ncbi:SDR family NAD(P)-dependent oxidoreductase [Sorangium sp. So ce375]|uniref:SDR family NAD(P)-dependent oxidoreductase n=1 Tax=Sorangium sp. So ce375 TaxID=3133306 RepID=UPI003F5AE031
MSPPPPLDPSALHELLLDRLGARLGVSASALDPRASFRELGLDSRGAVGLAAELAATLGRSLPPTLLWTYATPELLARHLAGVQRERLHRAVSATQAPIAIVGMACRFPGAHDTAALWDLLRDAREATREAPADRFPPSIFDDDPTTEGKSHVRRGCFLESVDAFDPRHFGISPREAASMDPQQRLVLELAWEALLDAGARPSTLRGSRAGVFIGAIWLDYAALHDGDLAGITPHAGTGHRALDIIANRVSYVLDLHGPSLVVDTACSSSLVAIHLACQSLRSGECETALVGGVSLMLAPETHVALSKFGGLAPDGRCKAFDARADGYGRGEGAAIVVLKPLVRALADGDRVYALIRGTAVNSDGASNGLTAPNPAAQEALLREACARAGVDPAEVAYVEAHGTGTALGDPIEAQAVGAVYGQGRPAERPLRIGSIKTNIGHLEGAAGIAGLVKVALSLHRRELPPSLHFQDPNPLIPFRELGLTVQTEHEAWPAGVPLLAGVSSFGWGGTNAHAILEGTSRPPARIAWAGAGEGSEAAPSIAFVFAPQGGQWRGMGRALLAQEPVFRAAAQACDAAFSPHLGVSLVELLTGLVEHPRLGFTDLVQPMIFTVQVALAALLEHWGVRPDVVIGHSIGELSAAHVAGALSLEDACLAVHHYSAVQGRTATRSGMALVELAADAVDPWIADRSGVWIGAYNGPSSTVLSGDAGALDELIAALASRGVFAARIDVDVAAHSPRIDPVLGALREALAPIAPRAGALKQISSLHGRSVDGRELGASYWADNLRRPVQLSRSVDVALADGCTHFVELGPHPILQQALRQIVSSSGRAAVVLAAMRRGDDPRATLVQTAAALASAGAHVRWERVPAELVPAPPPARQADAALVALSAPSPAGLRRAAEALVARLDRGDAPRLLDLAYTSAARRDHEKVRAAVQAFDLDELRAGLEAVAAAPDARPAARPPRVLFVYPGQGSQWPGMGAKLFAEEPVFREALLACDAAMQPELGASVLRWLDQESPPSGVDQVQPALFAIQVGLTALWRSFGVDPSGVVGHSMGEVAAAVAAGGLDLADAGRVICRRSRLLSRVRGGAMAWVELAPDAAKALVRDVPGLCVAAINGPRACVLAGEPAAIDACLAALQRRGLFCRRINVDVASHSAFVDPLLDPLRAELEALQPRAVASPFYSTVLGRRLSDEPLGADYWARNLREPVLLAPAVTAALADGYDAIVEISPHPTLLPALADVVQQAGATAAVLPSMERGVPERTTLLRTVAALFAGGAAIAFPRVARPGAVVSLPPFPFERERSWSPRPRAGVPSGGSPRVVALDPAHAPGVRLWQRTLGRGEPWIDDHLVRGRVIVPAAGIVAMAIGALRLGPDAAERIVRLEMPEALAVPEEGVTTTQLARLTTGPASAHLRLSSASADNSGWTLHARADVEGPGRRDARQLDVAAKRSQLEGRLDGAELYAALARRGIEHGRRYRVIDELRFGPGEALAWIGGGRRPEAEDLALDPALVDGALQALLLMLPGGEPRLGAVELALPVAIDEVLLQGKPSGGAWAHVEVHAEAGVARGDVGLYDASGALVLALRGVRFQELRAGGPALYELAWEPLALPPRSGRSSGRWVVGGDPRGLGRALAARGREIGFHGRCIGTGATDVLASVEELASGEPVTDLVYLGGISSGAVAAASAAAELAHAARRALDDALAWVRAWLDAARPGHPPRLWIVTEGVWTARGSSALTGAPLWGLARVVACEHPELGCSMVDVEPELAPSTMDRLAALLASSPRERMVRLEAERCLVARLGRASAPEIPPRRSPDERLSFHAQADEGTGPALRTEPRRPPGPGQVEIAVAAAGLNFLDALALIGASPEGPRAAVPLGLECAGTVVAAGPGVSLEPGAPVVAVARGSLATHVLAEAALVLPSPPSLPAERAAALPIALMTAHHALVEVARVRRGERVLVHSAAGGVGLCAVHIARALGAEVLATAGTPEKRAYLRGLGISCVADSRSPDAFAAAVREHTGGRGVDVVLNSLAGAALPLSLSLLAPGGRFVEIGKRDLLAHTAIDLWHLKGNCSFSTVDLLPWLTVDPARAGELLRAALTWTGASWARELPLAVAPLVRAEEPLRSLLRGDNLGKLVVRAPETAALPLLRPDRCYVITGGLGGLGRAVARWLIAAGAQRVALVGRRGGGVPPELEGAGADVRVFAADVADPEQIARTLDRIEEALGPLGGVVHAAGVIADAPLERLDPATVTSVFAPKVTGAWNLHVATRGRALDLFVLFSSVSALLGLPGQAHYAAANAFLDALARHRRTLGLPGTSIQWGAWADIGLAAEAKTRAGLERQGIRAMPVSTCLHMLEAILSSSASVVAALDLRPEAFLAARGGPAEEPLLDARPPGARETMTGARPALELAGTPAQRRQRLAAFVRAQIGAVLHMDGGRIDAAAPLRALGVDSLLALELKRRIEGGIGAPLSATMIFNHPTLKDLCAYLGGLLDLDEEQGADVERGPDVGALLDEIDGLSDDEVRARLAKMRGTSA